MRVREYDRDRYDRMKRIDWLNTDKICKSKCLVVGAGALGNEVIKCLVLAGVGNIVLVDMDGIEESNLSRCVFFDSSDSNGRPKVEAVAERAKKLNPNVIIEAVKCRIQDLSDWDYDIVFGCLDNILARLHVNAHSTYFGIPYIDGATHGFRGKIQTVLSNGPCLQCGMNSSHLAMVNIRFSCTGKGTYYMPKVPAEITTTSIIAAMQVREAMKILSGKSEFCVHGVTYYDGETGKTEVLELDIDPFCPNHKGSEIK